MWTGWIGAEKKLERIFFCLIAKYDIENTPMGKKVISNYKKWGSLWAV